LDPAVDDEKEKCALTHEQDFASTYGKTLLQVCREALTLRP
jgi:hypothetical protein